MARVRFLQAVGGVDFSYVAGQEVDLPGEEASNWCVGGRAEMVRGETSETPERAQRPEVADDKPKATAKRTQGRKSTVED